VQDFDELGKGRKLPKYRMVCPYEEESHVVVVDGAECAVKRRLK
jgi:hypothetical protein